MRIIKNIVLHCTATPQNTTTQSILNYWRKVNGWKMPGYHYIINADGSVENLLPITQVANGVTGHNANSIHISYKGGVDAKNAPLDNRTVAQKATQIRLINELRGKFPDAKILGHRDFAGVTKLCPSFDASSWLKAVGINPK